MDFEVKKIWDIERTPETEKKLAERMKTRMPGSEGEMHTDLIRLKDYWYCSVKEELFPRSRVIRSKDGDNWETVKVFRWDGAYMAEPKFAITAEGNLMANINIQWGKMSRDDGEKNARRQHATYITTDGLNWGSIYCCPSGINTIRYDLTWYNGMGYSLAYCGRDYTGTLYRTRDGKNWRALAKDVLPEEHRTCHEEASLAFHPVTGDACALVRANPVYAIIGTSKAPYYTKWEWKRVTVDLGDGKLHKAADVWGSQMCGPKIKYLSDGRLLAAGICDVSTEEENLGRNNLSWMDPEKGILKLFAPLEGFMQYPGIVEHEGMIWVSCGTKKLHELYLLKVKIPD